MSKYTNERPGRRHVPGTRNFEAPPAKPGQPAPEPPRAVTAADEAVADVEAKKD